MQRALLRAPLPAWQPAQSAVSTAFPEATEAAAAILRRGGNAVDAAVAAGWALAVCEPSASGVGGQAAALVRTADGRVRAVDGHSHAPRRASEETITREQQQRGHRSCTIPSMPATLDRLHRRFGRLAWGDVLAPAIALAEQGFAVTALQRKQTGWVAGALRENAAAAAFFLPGGEPPRVGALLRQPVLAETLRRIAASGADELYRGELARLLADDMREHGGLIDEEDLASFAGPVEREPVSHGFRGLEVVTVPPPGGGLQLLLALALLERLAPPGAAEEDWYEAVALATFGAFRAREHAPLRPGDLTPALARRLLGEKRVAELVEELLHGGPLAAPAGEEPGDTTHLTVADGEGNVVALTQSIQSVFGAKVASPRLGFLYNNYLRTCPRYPHPARLAPHASSRSNASPALVLARDGSPLLALGSAGSRRITSSLLQVIGQVVDRGMSVAEAVAAPRVHALLGGAAWVESRLASPALSQRLGRRFARLVSKGPYSFAMGAVHALQFTASATLAAADPRRDGAGAALPREGSRS